MKNLDDHQFDSSRHKEIIFRFKVFTICFICGTWVLQIFLYMKPQLDFILNMFKNLDALRNVIRNNHVKYSRLVDSFDKQTSNGIDKQSNHKAFDDISNCSLSSLFQENSSNIREKKSKNFLQSARVKLSKTISFPYNEDKFLFGSNQLNRCQSSKLIQPGRKKIVKRLDP
jgi:hypothetical protein